MADLPTAPNSSHAAGSFALLSHSEHETQCLGAAIGALCEPGDLILLEGDLGAGKTALTQGIGRGLGVAGTINSPTFTLVKEYAGRLPLFHFDLYRLDDPAQVDDLGIDDYLDAGGVSVVEWAERAAALWPERWLRVRLEVAGVRTRRLLLDASGTRGHALCQALLHALNVPSTPSLESVGASGAHPPGAEPVGASGGRSPYASGERPARDLPPTIPERTGEP